MASELNGVSDEVLRRVIRECRVDLWLLPSGGEKSIVHLLMRIFSLVPLVTGSRDEG
jgi:hypothetical protein